MNAIVTPTGQARLIPLSRPGSCSWRSPSAAAASGTAIRPSLARRQNCRHDQSRRRINLLPCRRRPRHPRPFTARFEASRRHVARRRRRANRRSTTSVDTTWENPFGKRRTVRNHYNELTLLLLDRATKKIYVPGRVSGFRRRRGISLCASGAERFEGVCAGPRSDGIQIPVSRRPRLLRRRT